MTIYNKEHIVIQKILGRRFNNPLGTAPLKIIESFYKQNARPLNVIDIGCGRGASISWLAERIEGRFVGIDPSPFMLGEAKKIVAKKHLEKKVILKEGTIFDISAAESFDFALLMDVLSWVNNKTAFLKRLAAIIKRSGFLFVSDYFCLNKGRSVMKICDSWNIGVPHNIAGTLRVFDRFGLRPVYLVDSTANYLEHWKVILGRIKQRSRVITGAVDREAYLLTKKRAASIVEAVRSGGFGHYFAIMADKENKNVRRFLSSL